MLGLGPEPLDSHSLSEAIALELAWAESAAGLQTRLVVVGEPGALAAETVRQLFRIVQESLTNVVEHAAAKSVRVGLVYGDGEVTVLVEDDGRGFDVASLTQAPRRPLRGLGLQGLAARAQHLGGTVHIESTPEWGTRVRAELPVDPPARDEAAHARWRVLVVHSSALIRSGLVRMLGLAEPDIQVVGRGGGRRERRRGVRPPAPERRARGSRPARTSTGCSSPPTCARSIRTRGSCCSSGR